MKNGFAGLVVAGSFIATAAAMGGQVTVSTTPGSPWEGTATVNGGRGGGFRVANYNSTYNGTTNTIRGGGTFSFISFCIEADEFLGGGGTIYNTSFTTAAIGGGLNVPPGDSDPLDAVTATMYREFRLGGTFGGKTNAGASWTTAETNALQIAIWFTEQELGSLNAAGGVTPAELTLAQDMLNWASIAANQVGALQQVRVLHMMNLNGSPSQDLLTLVPVPPAAWAGLTTLAGVGAIGVVRRRRAAAQ